MKQLIKMSVAVLGVLCGSVSGMWRSTVNMNNAVSQMLVAMRANNAVLQTPAAGVNENNTASQTPVVNVDDAVWQIPAVDVNTSFKEANKRLRISVPIVHQYKIEDVLGPNFRVSMRIDPKSLRGGIKAVNGICTPLNGVPLANISGVDPEFWITVISRGSIQSAGQRIQFRPQWAGYCFWRPGMTVKCPSTSHVSIFFNRGNERRVFSQESLDDPKVMLQLHPYEKDSNAMAISPSCFDLPDQVQVEGSFAVAYHTVCRNIKTVSQNIKRDIYGIILVYDAKDMASFEKTEEVYLRDKLKEIFPNTQGVQEELMQDVINDVKAAYQNRSVRDVFRNAPVVKDCKLHELFE